MPIPEVKKLEAGSEDPQMKAALSACIAEEIRNGTEPAQAQAICYSMIKDKTGKEMGATGVTPNG
jgi:hypothetical protein